MSERINNREQRKEVIKRIISQLHHGKTVDEVKQQFDEAFSGVSASEISEAEQALISEGLPVEEVQRLCDVHAAVFKGSIEEIHRPVTEIPGHPAYVLIKENEYISRLIQVQIRPLLAEGNLQKLNEALQELSKIKLHYARKENLMFPYMEKYGITAPPKVMWGVDDEIRKNLKDLRASLSQATTLTNALKVQTEEVLNKILEMIFKEENIMLPMLLERLTQDEWKLIAQEGKEIGYILDDLPVWNPDGAAKAKAEELATQPGAITLPSGVFKLEELISMLNTLPIDITFVDKDDTVKYFSEGKERIFPRPRTAIGRNVENCHPPASVHIVKDIIRDFKSGKKDHEDFWINMRGMLVLIRYFAVRDQNGEYLGVLEMSQNIKPLQELTGEKRLMS